MIKVGITGQSGFIGTHLFNFLNLKKDQITLIPFEDCYFHDDKKLNEFARNCDAIVHLAAMNRHNDPGVIYNTNIKLVRQVIGSLESTGSKPHVLMSSSTQEERDNMYGRSKLEGRMLFEQWASKNNAAFTGLIIPNVFGPFGNPYYNSVIATFCHQLTRNEQPHIETDAELRLIYVQELVETIYRHILSPVEQGKTNKIVIPFTSEKKVSDILNLLLKYRSTYFERHSFPELTSVFERNLFNTFRCYIDHRSYFPVILKKNEDQRGVYTETVRTSLGGQFSFSTTHPGITRGNHFHTRKIERFIVIKGRAVIELRRIGTSEKISFGLNGENPSFVDMPVWYTHNIKNTGEEDLITLFWINEFYDPEDQDTFYEEV
jgi:UDP-2-acetamido-2,6-beta-L-arabino-hexul-4-ose reductase